mmetsp:Transcript_30270/g.69634  ORF Transcript_30270/g.69634 Transcript_30270/m.69634 type:complete len:2658 (+) Transcript_30270:79-8052(+)
MDVLAEEGILEEVPALRSPSPGAGSSVDKTAALNGIEPPPKLVTDYTISSGLQWQGSPFFGHKPPHVRCCRFRACSAAPLPPKGRQPIGYDVQEAVFVREVMSGLLDAQEELTMQRRQSSAASVGPLAQQMSRLSSRKSSTSLPEGSTASQRTPSKKSVASTQQDDFKPYAGSSEDWFATYRRLTDLKEQVVDLMEGSEETEDGQPKKHSEQEVSEVRDLIGSLRIEEELHELQNISNRVDIPLVRFFDDFIALVEGGKTEDDAHGTANPEDLQDTVKRLGQQLFRGLMHLDDQRRLVQLDLEAGSDLETKVYKKKDLNEALNQSMAELKANATRDEDWMDQPLMASKRLIDRRNQILDDFTESSNLVSGMRGVIHHMVILGSDESGTMRKVMTQDELRSVRQVNHELREDEAEEETNPLHQHHDPKVMHAKTQMQLSFMGLFILRRVWSEHRAYRKAWSSRLREHKRVKALIRFNFEKELGEWQQDCNTSSRALWHHNHTDVQPVKAGRLLLIQEGDKLSLQLLQEAIELKAEEEERASDGQPHLAPKLTQVGHATILEQEVGQQDKQLAGGDEEGLADGGEQSPPNEKPGFASETGTFHIKDEAEETWFKHNTFVFSKADTRGAKNATPVLFTLPKSPALEDGHRHIIKRWTELKDQQQGYLAALKHQVRKFRHGGFVNMALIALEAANRATMSVKGVDVKIEAAKACLAKDKVRVSKILAIEGAEQNVAQAGRKLHTSIGNAEAKLSTELLAMRACDKSCAPAIATDMEALKDVVVKWPLESAELMDMAPAAEGGDRRGSTSSLLSDLRTPAKTEEPSAKTRVKEARHAKQQDVLEALENVLNHTSTIAKELQSATNQWSKLCQARVGAVNDLLNDYEVFSQRRSGKQQNKKKLEKKKSFSKKKGGSSLELGGHPGTFAGDPSQVTGEYLMFKQQVLQPLQTQIQRVQQEIAQHKDRTFKAEGNCDTLKSELEVQKQVADKLESTYDTLIEEQAEADRLRDAVAAKEAELTELKRKRDVLKSDNDRTHDQVVKDVLHGGRDNACPFSSGEHVEAKGRDGAWHPAVFKRINEGTATVVWYETMKSADVQVGDVRLPLLRKQMSDELDSAPGSPLPRVVENMQKVPGERRPTFVSQASPTGRINIHRPSAVALFSTMMRDAAAEQERVPGGLPVHQEAMLDDVRISWSVEDWLASAGPTKGVDPKAGASKYVDQVAEQLVLDINIAGEQAEDWADATALAEEELRLAHENLANLFAQADHVIDAEKAEDTRNLLQQTFSLEEEALRLQLADQRESLGEFGIREDPVEGAAEQSSASPEEESGNAEAAARSSIGARASRNATPSVPSGSPAGTPAVASATPTDRSPSVRANSRASPQQEVQSDPRSRTVTPAKSEREEEGAAEEEEEHDERQEEENKDEQEEERDAQVELIAGTLQGLHLEQPPALSLEEIPEEAEAEQASEGLRSTESPDSPGDSILGRLQVSPALGSVFESMQAAAEMSGWSQVDTSHLEVKEQETRAEVKEAARRAVVGMLNKRPSGAPMLPAALSRAESTPNSLSPPGNRRRRGSRARASVLRGAEGLYTLLKADAPQSLENLNADEAEEDPAQEEEEEEVEEDDSSKVGSSSTSVLRQGTEIMSKLGAKKGIWSRLRAKQGVFLLAQSVSNSAQQVLEVSDKAGPGAHTLPLDEQHQHGLAGSSPTSPKRARPVANLLARRAAIANARRKVREYFNEVAGKLDAKDGSQDTQNPNEGIGGLLVQASATARPSVSEAKQPRKSFQRNKLATARAQKALPDRQPLPLKTTNIVFNVDARKPAVIDDVLLTRQRGKLNLERLRWYMWWQRSVLGPPTIPRAVEPQARPLYQRLLEGLLPDFWQKHPVQQALEAQRRFISIRLTKAMAAPSEAPLAVRPPKKLRPYESRQMQQRFSPDRADSFYLDVAALRAARKRTPSLGLVPADGGRQGSEPEDDHQGSEPEAEAPSEAPLRQVQSMPAEQSPKPTVDATPIASLRHGHVLRPCSATSGVRQLAHVARKSPSPAPLSLGIGVVEKEPLSVPEATPGSRPCGAKANNAATVPTTRILASRGSEQRGAASPPAQGNCSPSCRPTTPAGALLTAEAGHMAEPCPEPPPAASDNASVPEAVVPSSTPQLSCLSKPPSRASSSAGAKSPKAVRPASAVTSPAHSSPAASPYAQAARRGSFGLGLPEPRGASRPASVVSGLISRGDEAEPSLDKPGARRRPPSASSEVSSAVLGDASPALSPAVQAIDASASCDSETESRARSGSKLQVPPGAVARAALPPASAHDGPVQEVLPVGSIELPAPSAGPALALQETCGSAPRRPTSSPGSRGKSAGTKVERSVPSIIGEAVRPATSGVCNSLRAPQKHPLQQKLAARPATTAACAVGSNSPGTSMQRFASLVLGGKQKHPPDFCVEASGLLAQQEGDELGEGTGRRSRAQETPRREIEADQAGTVIDRWNATPQALQIGRPRTQSKQEQAGVRVSARGWRPLPADGKSQRKEPLLPSKALKSQRRLAGCSESEQACAELMDGYAEDPQWETLEALFAGIDKVTIDESTELSQRFGPLGMPFDAPSSTPLHAPSSTTLQHVPAIAGRQAAKPSIAAKPGKLTSQVAAPAGDLERRFQKRTLAFALQPQSADMP